MKSVGEAMSLGRNFAEALNKAMRSMETKAAGFWTLADKSDSLDEALTALRTPHDGRLYTVERALRLARRSSRCTRRAAGSTRGSSTRSRRWSTSERTFWTSGPRRELLRRAKRSGSPTNSSPRCGPSWPARTAVRTLRHRLGVRPVYKTVDTCAAEFEADTPYHYSTYDEETEVAPRTARRS